MELQERQLQSEHFQSLRFGLLNHISHFRSPILAEGVDESG